MSLAGVLRTAVDYMNSIGFDNIQQQELEFAGYMEQTPFGNRRFKNSWH
jgi:selenocysteine lyase/cysteine desulfurase